MSLTTAHPIQTLREQATALEAALSVCLAEVKPRAVHKLRTATRRLEAQIRLVNALKGLPSHRKLSDKVLRQLSKIRKEAGKVRDLDVQIKLLQTQSKRHPRPSQANADTKAEAVVEFADRRGEDFQQMIAAREKRREEEAAILTDLVKHRQAKISAAVERLLKALEPADGFKLPTQELIAIAEKGFVKNPGLRAKKPNDETLHSIRKAAKIVRYLTETSGSRAAMETAKRYESLQEAGGQWHDWFDLAHAAGKELGRKHIASHEFATLRDRRLVTYRTLLETFR